MSPARENKGEFLVTGHCTVQGKLQGATRVFHVHLMIRPAKLRCSPIGPICCSCAFYSPSCTPYSVQRAPDTTGHKTLFRIIILPVDAEAHDCDDDGDSPPAKREILGLASESSLEDGMQSARL